MLTDLPPPFQNDKIIPFILKINEQYLNPPCGIVQKQGIAAYVSEQIINPQQNRNDETQIFFWLWRIQRYFRIDSADQSADSVTNTKVYIASFLNRFLTMQSDIQAYLCTNQNALNCLFFTLMLSQDKSDWQKVLELIQAHNPKSLMLPMLGWYHALVFGDKEITTESTLDSMTKHLADDGSFELPDSPLSRLFGFVTLAEWLIKSNGQEPTHAIKLLLTGPVLDDMSMLPPFLVELPINAKYIKGLLDQLLVGFVAQFRVPTTSARHAVASYNHRAFHSFLCEMIFLYLHFVKHINKAEQLTGLAHLIQFFKLKTQNFYLNTYLLINDLLNHLMNKGQYLDAYELYADVVAFDTTARAVCGSALYCFIARMDQWLSGSEPKPSYSETELRLLPHLNSLRKYLKPAEINSDVLYLLCLRLGVKYTESQDEGIRKMCKDNYLLVNNYLPAEELQQVKLLFQKVEPPKPAKVPKQNRRKKPVQHFPSIEEGAVIAVEQKASASTSGSALVIEEKAANKAEEKIIASEVIAPEVVQEASAPKVAKEVPAPKAAEEVVAPKVEEVPAPKVAEEVVASKVAEDVAIPQVTSPLRHKTATVVNRFLSSRQISLNRRGVLSKIPMSKPFLTKTIILPKDKPVRPVSTKSWSIQEQAPDQMIDPSVWPDLSASKDKLYQNSLTFFPIDCQDQFIARDQIPQLVMDLIDGLRTDLSQTHWYLSGAAPSNILDGIKPNDYDFLVMDTDIPQLVALLQKRGFKPEVRSQTHPIIFCPIAEGLSLDFTVIVKKPEQSIAQLLREDFAKRDYNVNALYCEMTASNQFKVFSFDGALQSRNNKTITAINNPTLSFKHDPTRVVRLVKVLISHPTYQQDAALQAALHGLRGKWLRLFRGFIIKPGNKDRFNHAINKLFSRHDYTVLNQTLAKMGALRELCGNGLKKANSACAKIPAIPTGKKFLFWVMANMLQGTPNRRRWFSLCPTESLITLTYDDQKKFTQIKLIAQGRTPKHPFFDQHLITLTQGFQRAQQEVATKEAEEKSANMNR